MAVLLRRSPIRGIILGGMHRLEGLVAGFLEEQCLYMAQRQHRVSTACRCGSLDSGRALMNSCRAVVLSGAVVAPTVGLVRGFTSVYHS
jgi:hypothetical protein